LESRHRPDAWLRLCIEIVQGKCSNSIQCLGTGTERRVRPQRRKNSLFNQHWLGQGRPGDLGTGLCLRRSRYQSQRFSHFRDVFRGKAPGLDVEDLGPTTGFGSGGRRSLWSNGFQSRRKEDCLCWAHPANGRHGKWKRAMGSASRQLCLPHRGVSP